MIGNGSNHDAPANESRPKEGALPDQRGQPSRFQAVMKATAVRCRPEQQESAATG